MPSSPFGHTHARSNCYATWYIRRTAKGLVGKYGFRSGDAEDLAQELALHLIKQWPLYDTAKGKVTTFIQNIVDVRVCELLRDQRRRKRDNRGNVPLSQADGAAEYGSLDGIRGQPETSDHELIDLRADCESILSRLPSDLKQIAVLLKTMLPSAVAKELHIPEGTLWNRMAELRDHFMAEGYDLGDQSHELLTQENA